MFRLGGPEIMICIAVFLLLFGPKKLPEIGKSLGQTIRNLRWSMKQIQADEPPDPHYPETDSK
jgi:sec-independent protein translocase protein TatA